MKLRSRVGAPPSAVRIRLFEGLIFFLLVGCGASLNKNSESAASPETEAELEPVAHFRATINQDWQEKGNWTDPAGEPLGLIPGSESDVVIWDSVALNGGGTSSPISVRSATFRSSDATNGILGVGLQMNASVSVDLLDSS